jgi:hypothetical protein
MYKRIAVILSAAAVVALSACSATPSQESQDRLGVQVATMALIEHAGNPTDKAERILDAVKAARTLLDMADVTAPDVRVALLNRVAERFAAGKLSPLEKLAALELVNQVSDEVERRLGTGLLTTDQRVTVNKVLDWVQTAAASYVPN